MLHSWYSPQERGLKIRQAALKGNVDWSNQNNSKLRMCEIWMPKQNTVSIMYVCVVVL